MNNVGINPSYNLSLSLCICSSSTSAGSTNHGLCRTVVFTIEKYPRVSGRAQLQPALFRGQPSFFSGPGIPPLLSVLVVPRSLGHLPFLGGLCDHPPVVLPASCLVISSNPISIPGGSSENSHWLQTLQRPPVIFTGDFKLTNVVYEAARVGLLPVPPTSPHASPLVLPSSLLVCHLFHSR